MENTKQNESKEKKLKSKAKAAGVKSVFVIGDQLLMTSFGRGNESVAEKKVDDDRAIHPINMADPQYEASYFAKQFSVEGKIAIADKNGKKAPVTAVIQDNFAVCPDQLGFKEKLEQRYYGKTFADNIHIQLVYNILDIEKILAPHVNNIVYTLDALMRSEKRADPIGIGYITTRNIYQNVKDRTLPKGKYYTAEEEQKQYKYLDRAYDTFCDFLGSDGSPTEKRLAYFGELFYEYDSFYDQKAHKKVSGWWLKKDAEVYYILGLISDLRQFCSEERNVGERMFLYSLESELNPEAGACLDRIFEKKAQKLAKDAFAQTGGKADFDILLNIYGLQNGTEEQKRGLIQEYYDFKIKKEYKNLGFSIKKLREKMLESPEGMQFASDKHSTYRHKLYGFIDFIISKHFKETLKREETIQQNVFAQKLRACETDAEKEQVYSELAADTMKQILPKTEKALSLIRNYIANSNNKKENREVSPENSKLVESIDAIPTKASYFSELIYLLTCLLDGKEINTLCTELIHKFDNIAGLNELMREQGIENKFIGDYGFFNNSDTIVTELRQVNNMARMSKPLDDVDTTFELYREAAEILGIAPEDEENLKFILNLDNHDFYLKPNGKKAYNKNFRNFIINNVICSRRFHYLIRFGAPCKLRNLATNRAVIDFVLKDIPETQIRRYYESCTGRTDTEKAGVLPETMRSELAERLQKVNFNDFKDVNNKDNVEKNPNGDKAKLQAIVRLYLTVPYLFLKNMVNINARYTMAFHCLERDSNLYLGKDKNNKGYSWLVGQYEAKRREKADKLEAEYREKKERGEKAHTGSFNRIRHQLYTETDMKNTTDWTRSQYRNFIVHLNLISEMADYIPDNAKITSYFGAYHLGMQRYLAQNAVDADTKPNGEYARNKTAEYYAAVQKSGTYCKDFLKALNAPFAYNLPRFKNLSIECLFDKNIEYEKDGYKKESDLKEKNEKNLKERDSESN